MVAPRAPGSDLDGSGRPLGALRSALGGFWDCLGGLLSSLEGLWGSSWGHLGDPWGVTKGFWSTPGELLGPSWQHLKTQVWTYENHRFFVVFKWNSMIFQVLRAALEASECSWRPPGDLLRHPGALLRLPEASWRPLVGSSRSAQMGRRTLRPRHTPGALMVPPACLAAAARPCASAGAEGA